MSDKQPVPARLKGRLLKQEKRKEGRVAGLSGLGKVQQKRVFDHKLSIGESDPARLNDAPVDFGQSVQDAVNALLSYGQGALRSPGGEPAETKNLHRQLDDACRKPTSGEDLGSAVRDALGELTVEQLRFVREGMEAAQSKAVPSWLTTAGKNTVRAVASRIRAAEKKAWACALRQLQAAQKDRLLPHVENMCAAADGDVAELRKCHDHALGQSEALLRECGLPDAEETKHGMLKDTIGLLFGDELFKEAFRERYGRASDQHIFTKLEQTRVMARVLAHIRNQINDHPEGECARLTAQVRSLLERLPAKMLYELSKPERSFPLASAVDDEREKAVLGGKHCLLGFLIDGEQKGRFERLKTKLGQSPPRLSAEALIEEARIIRDLLECETQFGRTLIHPKGGESAFDSIDLPDGPGKRVEDFVGSFQQPKAQKVLRERCSMDQLLELFEALDTPDLKRPRETVGRILDDQCRQLQDVLGKDVNALVDRIEQEPVDVSDTGLVDGKLVLASREVKALQAVDRILDCEEKIHKIRTALSAVNVEPEDTDTGIAGAIDTALANRQGEPPEGLANAMQELAVLSKGLFTLTNQVLSTFPSLGQKIGHAASVLRYVRSRLEPPHGIESAHVEALEDAEDPLRQLSPQWQEAVQSVYGVDIGGNGVVRVTRGVAPEDLQARARRDYSSQRYLKSTWSQHVENESPSGFCQIFHADLPRFDEVNVREREAIFCLRVATELGQQARDAQQEGNTAEAQRLNAEKNAYLEKAFENLRAFVGDNPLLLLNVSRYVNQASLPVHDLLSERSGLLRLPDGRWGNILGSRPHKTFTLGRNDAGEIVLRIEVIHREAKTFSLKRDPNTGVPLIPEASSVRTWVELTFKEDGERVLVSEPLGFEYKLTEATLKNVLGQRDSKYSAGRKRKVRFKKQSSIRRFDKQRPPAEVSKRDDERL